MITDEEIEFGLDEAMRQFRRYATGIRGQTITQKDQSDYWAFVVGYQLGQQSAVPEGWQNEHIRQYMHNDGIGFVAAYDKDGIDAMLAAPKPQGETK